MKSFTIKWAPKANIRMTDNEIIDRVRETSNEDFAESIFEIEVGTEISYITVVHNLPGRMSEPAFDNWLARAGAENTLIKDFSVWSFIRYINSKELYCAMTLNQWQRLQK